MQKQPSPVLSQGEALLVNDASLLEDSLALQESDFTNPLIYQYLESLTKKTASSTPDITIKRLISKSIWPRLVAIRIRTVLVTLIPVINIVHQDCLLSGLSYVQLCLGLLGWVLHALRLLINLLRLLMCCLPCDESSSPDQKLTWQTRLQTELAESQTELGNDLLWILTVLTTSTHVAASVAIMLIDIAWVMYCGYAELTKLNQFKSNFEQIIRSESISPQELADIEACQDNLQKRIAYTQKKLILNLLTTISTTILAFLRIVIMPSLFPMLAINPALLLGFALLSLVVTLASHFIGEWLKLEKPPEKITGLEKTVSFINDAHFIFFKPSNKNDVDILVSVTNQSPLVCTRQEKSSDYHSTQTSP